MPLRRQRPSSQPRQPIVRVIAELMDVIRDLCACSAAFSILGEHAWAAALVEQSAELLAHRARLIARLRRDRMLEEQPSADGSSRFKGSKWTN
jgi:hypothetical protein